MSLQSARLVSWVDKSKSYERGRIISHGQILQGPGGSLLTRQPHMGWRAFGYSLAILRNWRPQGFLSLFEKKRSSRNGAMPNSASLRLNHYTPRVGGCNRSPMAGQQPNWDLATSCGARAIS